MATKNKFFLDSFFGWYTFSTLLGRIFGEILLIAIYCIGWQWQGRGKNILKLAFFPPTYSIPLLPFPKLQKLLPHCSELFVYYDLANSIPCVE